MRKTKFRRWFGLIIFMIILAVIPFGFWSGGSKKSAAKRDIVNQIRRKLLTERMSQSDPINILLIGSDSRHGENARSDTLIFMNINFQANRVYLISIPRDTRAYIPGRGMDKINAAYAYGQAGLSIRTVQNFFGVDLNHYMEVDFEGFKELVDTLGGIDINVKKGIDDRSSGYSMHIPQGRQRMNGDQALNYVRYRHGDSDFNRAERQQEFLRALAANTLQARTVLKLPKLIDILHRNVSTDMSKSEMIELGTFLRQLPKNRIESITVTGECKDIEGISYVEADPEFLMELMERVDKGQSLAPMKSQSESDKMSMKNDPGSIAILNGTDKLGLATKARTRLARYGISDIRIGDADNSKYRRTQIKFKEKDRVWAERFRRLLLKSAVLKEIDSTASKSGIEIILGSDYNRAGLI
jgi:LCP family protein required for cell wall assembly